MPSEKPLRCADYIARLEPLWPLEQIELDRLTFIQRTVSVLLDGGEMNEHVLTSGALDESVSLRPVEPLHSTLLSHKELLSPLFRNYSRSLLSVVLPLAKGRTPPQRPREPGDATVRHKSRTNRNGSLSLAEQS